MSATSKPKDLFIVDNSISGWTGLRYLDEWAGISDSFDIATGYFEIGSLLALDGKWQNLDKIRVLMGAETTHRTRNLILASVKNESLHKLDNSLNADKEHNPFQKGIPAILEALRSRKIECRVYDKDKFHAKAYITHAKMEVVGSQALVGSSNFTKPGLTENVELNVQIQSAREVAQLQEWFEEHWKEATEITEAVIDTIAHHTRLYTPFEVYAKALQEFFKGHELTANEWDETRSKMFPQLDRYQQEAYWSLMKIARQHGGAFLCDGVGLGKTFVGLMLIERLVLHEGKRVVLFAPKGAKEGVWEPHLKRWLPHIGGIGGSADFSNLAVFSHTDIGRSGDYPARFQRVTELADAVIIDEAHHFRNPGRRGDAGAGRRRSRYYQLYDILDPAVRKKAVFMLTATPINNRLSDLRHMAELFTRQDETYFARTLGINNLRAHFVAMERRLRDMTGRGVALPEDNMQQVNELLATDHVVRNLVVQRSRSYARASQMNEKGTSAVFPTRTDPQVADYSIRKTYGLLLERFESAFERTQPLFTLPMYYPLAWYRGPDETIDPLEEGRQAQVVGLIRTNFLKRFESSVAAFEMSCDRLLKKLIGFVKVHSSTDAEKKRLQRWMAQNADVIDYVMERQGDLWDDGDDSDLDEDIVHQELLDSIDELPRDEYDVPEMLSETFLDLDQVVVFLEEAKKFEPKHDDKLKKLIRLLKSKGLKDQKVLIFTEFADTGSYLSTELSRAGIEGLFQIDSGTKRNRREVVEEFAPYYNGLSSTKLEENGRTEIRVLISTDVLSEGLNLQDASNVINYDIHWNPVRLMQRIGRVDRRLDVETEQRLKQDHPEVADQRGKIRYWNFLPPDELNEILTLYNRVTHKTLLISKTLGIEGRKLLTPDDDYEALKEFNHNYEGTRTPIEEMHLEYQEIVLNDPTLVGTLENLPKAIFSGKKLVPKGQQGLFLCYSLPAFDKQEERFTDEAGTTAWYYYDLAKAGIAEDPGEIVVPIRSDRETKRRCKIDEKELISARNAIEKHIKNTHLKRVNAPLGVKPTLMCWMELN